MSDDWSDLGRRRNQPGESWGDLGRSVSYYETGRGRARVTTTGDGSLWLETDDGFSGGLDRFPDARPVFVSDGPAQSGDGSRVAPRQRNLRERFTSVVEDAARRNPVVAIARTVTDAQPVWTPGAPLMSGGLLPSWEDRPLTVRDPGTGENLTYTSIGQQMRADERERREAYQQQADADGWTQARGGPLGQAAAGATNVTGAIVGAMADPLNMISPGRTIVGRIVGGAAVNAAGDAVTQAADIGSGLQETYSPLQTLAAGAIGGVIQGGMEGAGVAAKRLSGNPGGVVEALASEIDAGSRSPAASGQGSARTRADAGRIEDWSDLARATRGLDPTSQPRPARTRQPIRTDADTVTPAMFMAPVDGIVVSGFGRRNRPNARASANHQGLDFRAPEGTPARATAAGEVIFAGRRGNYGNRLTIRHADGSESSYSHLSAFDVRVGDRVSAGQTVARTGSTGNVTGPHLHFEISRNGRYIDPQTVLGREAPAGRFGDTAESRSEARLGPFEQLGPDSAGSASERPDAVAEPEMLGMAGLGVGEPLSRARDDGRNSVRLGLETEPRRAAESADDWSDLASSQPSATRLPTASDLTPTSVVRRDDPDDWSDLSTLTPAVESNWSVLGRAREPQRLAIDMSGYADRIGQTVQSSGQSVSGLRDAPRPGSVARGAGATYQGKTVSQLADDLRAALGLTHRQGKLTMKRAEGEYDTGSGVVRTRAVDELDVLSHEAFHAFEYERQGPALRAALKANARDLEDLAYPGAAAGVKRQEGFAEFGRWYLTNPDHARRIAPKFFQAFEEALERDAPELLAKMRYIQASYQNVLSSASIDVATGSIAYTGRKGALPELIDEMRRRGVESTISRLADDAYTAFVDDLHPIAVATRRLTALYAANTGQKLDLKRANDPYALARLSREAYAAGHSDIVHGVTPYRGLDPEGVSLADALETAGLATDRLGNMKPEATREFDAYLIARRMVHEWDRYAKGDLPNPPDRNTREFHAQVIADADAAHPTWAQAAQQAYEFQNNLWRKEFEAGLITEESYRNGIDQHPDYVPLMRDMSDRGAGGGGKPRAALQFAGGVKAFEGSSRDIISPLSSIIRRSYELNAIIKRNETMIALDDLAQAAGRGAGAIVERLPAKQAEAVTVQAADALEKTAAEMGLTGRDLSTVQKLADDATNQDATITLFRQSEFSPRKGEAVVFVWRNGKKTPLLLPDGEFGQQMFQALAGMNKELQNVVVDTMAAMTQTLRYGVTLSPEFMAANVIRDQVATWINSDVGFVPVVDMVRGGASALTQDQNALRYANAGGMTGGANVAATRRPFPKTDAEAQAQLQMLRKKGYNVRRLVQNPWRALAEATDLSETSTRLGVFRRGFDEAKKRGLSDYEALIESGFTSRDYLDFGRRGSRMISASRIVTFLNAQVQGMDKTARVLSAGGNLKRVLMPLTQEARTPSEQRALGHAYKAWAKLAALGALGLGLRMLYADEPEYQEIGDQLRATNWVFRAGGQWVFIPKPFELATVSNILERAYEGTVLKDPTAGERLMSDFRNTIAPPHEIPALSIPFQIGANRDHLGRPIVPDHLRGTVDPELQFNAFTSDLGKLIGKTFDVSPAVVDHVITGYGGTLGRYVLQGSNIVGEAVTGRPRTEAGPEDWFLSRRFIRDISRGSTSQAEFWDQVSRDGGEMVRAEGSFRSLMRDGKDAEASAYLNRLPAPERAYVVAKVFAPEGQSIVHPLVRVQKAVGILSDLRSDVREGTMRDGQGAIIPLSPQQRRAIDGALSDFALAEMRNALISTGIKGWEQREPMDGLAVAERIRSASPDAYEQVWTRLMIEKAPTAITPEITRQLDATWQQWRPNLSARMDEAAAIPMLRDERARSGDRGSRYQEAQRRAGGAYAPGMMTGGRQSQAPAGQGLMTR